MDTATPIRELRKSLNLTQTEFAALLGVKQASISRAESGNRVSGRFLERIASATGKKIDVTFI